MSSEVTKKTCRFAHKTLKTHNSHNKFLSYTMAASYGD